MKAHRPVNPPLFSQDGGFPVFGSFLEFLGIVGSIAGLVYLAWRAWSTILKVIL